MRALPFSYPLLTSDPAIFKAVNGVKPHFCILEKHVHNGHIIYPNLLTPLLLLGVIQ